MLTLVLPAKLAEITFSCMRKGKAISLYLEDRFQQNLSLALRLESKDRIWPSVFLLYKCAYACTNADITTHL